MCQSKNSANCTQKEEVTNWNTAVPIFMSTSLKLIIFICAKYFTSQIKKAAWWHQADPKEEERKQTTDNHYDNRESNIQRCKAVHKGEKKKYQRKKNNNLMEQKTVVTITTATTTTQKPWYQANPGKNKRKVNMRHKP